MNEHDKNNLTFIMKLTPQQLSKWALSSTFDDVVYAKQLVVNRTKELQAKALMRDPDIENLKDAKKILSKFTLKAMK